MSDLSDTKNTSPVGWYVGSYLIRFIVLDTAGNDDPEAEFLAWENTVIVKADSLDEAYSKVVAIAEDQQEPYRGGPDGVPVRWVFEGLTDLLPIYEPLEDGAEILWAEHEAEKLKALRERVRSLDQLRR